MFTLRQLVRCAKSSYIPGRYVSSVSHPLVDLKVDNDDIALLTMQRPPVNSLNVELLTDLANALEEAERKKYRGIILTSGLASIFCAGMDIKEMYQPDVRRLEELWRAMRRVTEQLLLSGYVSTTAITGHTSAGGTILAILTEYRVMVDKPATISLNDTELDIPPPNWVVENMIHVMGGREAEIALTASTKFSPQEALKVKLIDETAVNEDDAVEKCKKFIKASDKIGLFIRKKTKENIRRNIINLWNVENKENCLQDYIKDVTSERRQKSLELYLQALKSNKRNKQ